MEKYNFRKLVYFLILCLTIFVFAVHAFPASNLIIKEPRKVKCLHSYIIHFAYTCIPADFSKENHVLSLCCLMYVVVFLIPHTKSNSVQQTYFKGVLISLHPISLLTTYFCDINVIVIYKFRTQGSVSYFKATVLDIYIVSIVFEPPHDKTNKMVCTPSEDSY